MQPSLETAVPASRRRGQLLRILGVGFGLAVMRKRDPDRPRPYRAWGYPWTTALALICSVAFLAGAVASDTRNSVYSLVLLGASYPAFHLLKWLARR